MISLCNDVNLILDTDNGHNDCHLVSNSPSIRERILLAGFGLVMILLGPIIFALNIQLQIWMWILVIITTWLGMSCFVMLYHSACRAINFRQDIEGVNDKDFNVLHAMTKTLKELGIDTDSDSVMLYSAKHTEWYFQVGWNCPPELGEKTATLLKGRVHHHGLNLLCISLPGGNKLAICDVIKLSSGGCLMIVLISEVNKPLSKNIGFLILNATRRIVGDITSDYI